jgi:hypothetical protein
MSDKSRNRDREIQHSSPRNQITPIMYQNLTNASAYIQSSKDGNRIRSWTARIGFPLASAVHEPRTADSINGNSNSLSNNGFASRQRVCDRRGHPTSYMSILVGVTTRALRSKPLAFASQFSCCSIRVLASIALSGIDKWVDRVDCLRTYI